MRIAIAQTSFQPRSLAEALAALSGHAERARAGGADLLLLPELFLSGYGDARMVRHLAVAADAPALAEAAETARAMGLAIALGFAERAGEALHNSAVLVTPAGRIGPVQRKMHLWGAFETATFRPGDRAAPTPLDAGAAGFLICYDLEHGPAAEDLVHRGARLLLAPSATSRGFEVIPEAVVRTRAYETGVPVAFANHAGVVNGLAFAGLSTLADATGRVIARAPADAPALLLADVALPETSGEHLRDRRADLFPPSPELPS